MTPITSGRVILTYGRSLMTLVIARSLAQRGVEVIACDDVDLTVASFSRHVKGTFTVAPWRTRPEAFLDDLETAVREHAPGDGRPYVLMPVFAEIELIARNRDRFEPTVKVAAPAWESIGLVTPKDQFARLVEAAHLPAPRTWNIPDAGALEDLAPRMTYPVMVKPSDGAGGRGVSVATSAAEATLKVRALGFSPPPLFQELAPGQDFCVAVLAGKGRLAAIMAYRNLTTFPGKAGAGALRETVDDEPFRAAAEQVLAATKWDGVAEINFRWTGAAADTPKLIEVNARFWAGIFHSIQTAVDFPWLLYLQTLGAPLDHVGQPDIGARTKTPGVWLMAAIEESADSAPHRAALEEAWRAIIHRLDAQALLTLRQGLAKTAAPSAGEVIDRLRAALAQAKGAPSEFTVDEDPLVGLGALFILSSLARYGKLPAELTQRPFETETSAAPARRAARPIVGVTASQNGETLSWWAMKFAVWLAGGKAARLTATAPRDPRTIDAVIFGGGSDIHPHAFNGSPKADYPYDDARGDMETSWGLTARRQDLPVLGICRGAQMLNVMAGGSLYMDLSGFEGANPLPSAWDFLTVRKRVRLAKGSRLAAVTGVDYLDVNVIHQQAIDRLGVGLVVAARQDNGVIQAIEDPSRRFWLGVQYHPELMIYRAAHRRLFSALVQAAKARWRERSEPAAPTSRGSSSIAPESAIRRIPNGANRDSP